MAKASLVLRDLSDAELVQKLHDARQELFNLRFQKATGELDNVARIAQVKREIARAETFLRQREINAAEAVDAGVENG